jgi:hypothetical protein
VSRVRRTGAERTIAAGLALLLVWQVVAVVALHTSRPRDPGQARCGMPLPAVDRTLPVDVDVQLGGELSPGSSTAGTVVIVNRSSRAVVVLATQAVLLTPAGREPVAPPEPRRDAGRLLRPGQLMRQRLGIDVRGCRGRPVPPGFYELAVVLLLQRPADRSGVVTVSPRRAVVVRPATS